MKDSRISSAIPKPIKRIVAITISSLIMAVNFNSFVNTGGLFPGGASGLTFLVLRLAHKFWSLSLPYTPINILMNAVPIFIGFKFIGRKFTLYSLLSIIEVSLFTDLLPSYVVTYDVLLISIFGGLINGFSVAICILVDATSGGMDFISIYLAQKRGIDSWNIVLAVNAVILAVAGFFFGWDIALYSIIFQFTSIQVLHLLDRTYQQETLLIVTEFGDKVCNAIYDISHHGATLIPGKGAHDGQNLDIVYSVVAGSQTKKVIKAIKEVDEKAFINTIETERISGRFHQEPKD